MRNFNYQNSTRLIRDVNSQCYYYNYNPIYFISFVIIDRY